MENEMLTSGGRIGGIAKQAFGVQRREVSRAFKSGDTASRVAENLDQFVRGKLQGPDFRHKKLRVEDFSGQDLQGAIFERADCSVARFDGAKLDGAIFRNTNLFAVEMRNARATGADFTGASLREANLAGSDFRGSTFTGVRLDQADLRNADLRNTRIDASVIEGAVLTGAKVDGAIITNTSFALSGLPDLRQATIGKGVDFQHWSKYDKIQLRDFRDLPSQRRKAQGLHPWRDQAI